MSMSISISNEGWLAIQEKLEEQNNDFLASALAAQDCIDEYERQENAEIEVDFDELEKFEEEKTQTYLKLDHDTLVHACLKLIEKNDTCTNDSSEFYIDSDGIRTIKID